MRWAFAVFGGGTQRLVENVRRSGAGFTLQLCRFGLQGETWVPCCCDGDEHRLS